MRRAEQPRYLAWPSAGQGDYTTHPGKRMQNEPEPVDDEWLESFTSDATAAHGAFTVRRAAEHAIRIVLRHEGPTDSSTVKAKVTEALDVDVRTVERAASDMTDLRRTRGYRSSARWEILTEIFTSDKHVLISRGPISAAAIREQVAIRMFGERQAPLATDAEIAAELLADHWRDLMNSHEQQEQDD